MYIGNNASLEEKLRYNDTINVEDLTQFSDRISALESEIKTLQRENELAWEQVSFARELVGAIESGLASVSSAKQAREAFRYAVENGYFEL